MPGGPPTGMSVTPEALPPGVVYHDLDLAPTEFTFAEGFRIVDFSADPHDAIHLVNRIALVSDARTFVAPGAHIVAANG